ncbi:Hypothetical protein R9X50_00320200 [Acrodontium crateriforme]|uniref:J domain-containing protein n=1 Tax=Acrodontium crateriforme TaxID=150365 RepID=A0AAQ3R9Q1_9PEZI|nr:Hypothetical protein R9X50_00320200 [Acrodontium crateriforme]
MPSKKHLDDESDLELDEVPTSINPYEELGISKDATQDQVKSAYRKAALKHHPDKAGADDKDAAHIKFQQIAFAYAILSDERRRKRYDTTGRTEESLDLEDDDFDWTTFYREQFADLVTLEKIDDFSKEYKGSEEERRDVLKAYNNAKGNMDKLYQQVMLSDPADDDERFRAIIDDAISKEEVEAHAKYSQETDKSKAARVARAKKNKEKEAKEAEKAAKEREEGGKAKGKKTKPSKSKSADSDASLAAMIQQRQQGRADNFFANLEAKYAGDGSGKKKGSKRAMDEPPEEAFAKNRKKGRS